jgi:hypothetical protein
MNPCLSYSISEDALLLGLDLYEGPRMSIPELIPQQSPANFHVGIHTGFTHKRRSLHLPRCFDLPEFPRMSFLGLKSWQLPLHDSVRIFSIYSRGSHLASYEGKSSYTRTSYILPDLFKHGVLLSIPHTGKRRCLHLPPGFDPS